MSTGLDRRWDLQVPHSIATSPSSSTRSMLAAVRDGDVTDAAALLKKNPGFTRYCTFASHNSPLHFAAAKGLNKVEALFDLIKGVIKDIDVTQDEEVKCSWLFMLPFLLLDEEDLKEEQNYVVQLIHLLYNDDLGEMLQDRRWRASRKMVS